MIQPAKHYHAYIMPLVRSRRFPLSGEARHRSFTISVKFGAECFSRNVHGTVIGCVPAAASVKPLRSRRHSCFPLPAYQRIGGRGRCSLSPGRSTCLVD